MHFLGANEDGKVGRAFYASPDSILGGNSDAITTDTPMKDAHASQPDEAEGICYSTGSSQDLDMEDCIKQMRGSSGATLTQSQGESEPEMNFEVPEFLRTRNSKATEYDRFIPQRQPDCGLGSNFENKDHIFSEKSLACHHTPYEAGCASFHANGSNNDNGKVGESAAPDTD